MRHKSFLPQFVTAMALAWCLSCGRSAAEVHLSGTRELLVLQVHDATMPEILAAVQSAFDLEVTLNGATARKFTGAYTGSLRNVLSRLLTGEDYVLRFASDGISIRLFSKSAADGAAARFAVPPAAPASRLIGLRQGTIKRTND
jgi:hypothetical protein